MSKLLTLLAALASVVASTDPALGANVTEEGAVLIAELDANLTAESAVAGACPRRLKVFAPACARACSGSCWAVSAAYNKYKSAGKSAALSYACKHASGFQCFFNKKACRGVVRAAASSGVPGSASALRRLCK